MKHKCSYVSESHIHIHIIFYYFFFPLINSRIAKSLRLFAQNDQYGLSMFDVQTNLDRSILVFYFMYMQRVYIVEDSFIRYGIRFYFV